MIDILSQAGDPSILAAAASESLWNWEWNNIPDELQKWCRTIGFVILVIWVAAFLAQFIIPSRRNRMGSGVSFGRFAGMIVLVVFLFDLSLIPKAVNLLGKGAWMIGDMFGVVDSSNTAAPIIPDLAPIVASHLHPEVVDITVSSTTQGEMQLVA